MTLTKKVVKAGRSKIAKARKQLTASEMFFYTFGASSYQPGTETPEQGRIRGAKALARAEQTSENMGWTYRWEWEEGGYEDMLGDHAYWCDNAKNGVEHEHEILYCVIEDAAGEMLNSLGGIIDPDSNYRRVVEAELALEAESELEDEIETLDAH